jgi:transcription initiation factor TFIID subunit 8
MYPILTQPKQQPVSFKEKKEAPPPHIPAWLPAFPDQHTYKSTAVFQGRQEEQQQPRQVRHQLTTQWLHGA